jgi:predicted small lipoprotein YifL
MKYFLKSYCSYFLFFFLCSCGVKGPLFFPPLSTAPVKPVQSEPIGKIYPIEKKTPTALESKDPNSPVVPSDNVTTIPSTIKN